MAAKFSFGRLEIDGRTYTRDVIILPDRVIGDWWRQEGHRLSLADLAEVRLDDIDTLVVGTGAYGAMRVPDSLIQHLQSRGLQVIVQPTAQALETFLRLREQKRRVAGAFHLTC